MRKGLLPCGLIPTLAPEKQMNILDLGCGPGLYSEIFAEEGHSVTGVDFSKTPLIMQNRKLSGRD